MWIDRRRELRLVLEKGMDKRTEGQLVVIDKDWRTQQEKIKEFLDKCDPLIR